MPRQPAELLVHTAITNHRIVVRQAEPYPRFPSDAGVSHVADLVWLDPVPSSTSALSGAVLLTAYREILLQHSDPIYKEHYSKLLSILAKRDHNHTVVLRGLAQRAAEEGTPTGTTEAIKDLEQIRRRGSAATTDYLALAELLTHAGRIREAITALREAISRDPYNPLVYELLARCYMLTGDQADAVKVANEGLNLFPENPFSRRQLDAILANNPLH
jgi:tetratricopeptide (TPR) repeat protein